MFCTYLSLDLKKGNCPSITTCGTAHLLLDICCVLLSHPAPWLAIPFPLPAGGYLALQVLELVRGGKKIDPDVEKGVMASGFLLLTSIGLFLIVKDALTLSSGL